MKKNYYIIIFIFFISIQSFSQTYNKYVEAKIFMQQYEELFKITGTAFNKTDINLSLRYVLSVIKSNPENSNRSKNDQSGRFVIDSGQKKELSSTTINKDTKDRIIILLLIYNIDDELIGKDRFVINDDSSKTSNETKLNLINKLEENDLTDTDEDGIVLRGIVLEEVKTKPGKDFYQQFFSDYLLNNINAKEIVKVKEVLLTATNTIISIFVDDKLVHRFLVKPQSDYLKSNSKIAIQRVSKYLVYLEKNKGNLQQY